MESAAGRRVLRAWDLGRLVLTESLTCWLPVPNHQSGSQQKTGIGMYLRVQHVNCWANLDDLAEIHDRQPVGQITYNTEVVRHNQIRDTQPLPEIT